MARERIYSMTQAEKSACSQKFESRKGDINGWLRRLPDSVRDAEKESLEEFMARGGKVTKCPPTGSSEFKALGRKIA